MDKYDIVLDIIGHPEKYSEEQLSELLADPETKEIYNLLCKTASAVEANKHVDVEAQWQTFSRRHIHKRRTLWFGSRSASIAAHIATSLVAVAIGIVVSVSTPERTSESDTYSNDNDVKANVTATADSVSMKRDSVPTTSSPVIFEDTPLQTIMEKVAEAYNVEVKFNNKEAASLHLYYKWNPALPLEEIIKQLNTFEQINIARTGNTISIN